MKLSHHMLDLETLSLRSDAAVFEVALVHFDSEHNHGMGGGRQFWECKVSTGHVCTETVHWWAQQTRKPNWTVGLEEPIMAQKIHAYLEALNLEHHKAVRLWGNTIYFDLPILINFLRRHGYGMPIHRSCMRDVRTVRELAGFPDPKRTSGDRTPHHPTSDCLEQIDKLRMAWNVLSPTNGAF